MSDEVQTGETTMVGQQNTDGGSGVIPVTVMNMMSHDGKGVEATEHVLEADLLVRQEKARREGRCLLMRSGTPRHEANAEFDRCGLD